MLSYSALQSFNCIIEIFFMISSVFGTIGNAITVLICLQKRLRNIPTSIFMIFIAIINIFPLTTIALISIRSHFLKFESNSVFFKLNTFFSFWTSHTTNYLIASILVLLQFNYLFHLI
jgi:hypothetical protein